MTNEQKQERQATALGFASMALIAAWKAARTEGETQAPAVLEEIEKRLEAGTAMLAVNLQRIGGTLRLTAAVLDSPTFQAAFEHSILDITGPLIVSREQLAHVAPVKPGDIN